jgi:phosphoglycerate dehydrogenase-like enzyme
MLDPLWIPFQKLIEPSVKFTGAAVSVQQRNVVVFLPDRSKALVEELDRYELPCRFIACETEEEAIRQCVDAEILVSNPIGAAAFEHAAKLRWIQSLSAGVELWMGAAPPSIPITRMTGVFEKYMAEYVFAYLLYESQGLAEIHELQRQKNWSPFNPRTLAGLTLGVAGAGHTGQVIGKLGKAFGMNVVVLGRTSKRVSEVAAFADQFYSRSQLSAFLSGLDVLVLTLPATPDTDRMFGLKEFMALPKGATVINIGRGQAIDEDALARVLRDGHIGRAVIDTFRTEPLPSSSPVWTLPNLTVTPHQAGGVYPHELAAVASRNIKTFLSGTIPEPQVDRGAGY